MRRLADICERGLVLGALTLGLALPATAQQPPLRDFPKAAVEVPDPFSQIGGVLELQDGKLLVVDQVEGALMIVDPATGSKSQVGRQGSGPGEYRTPTGLARLAGDTIWVFDGLQQRIVVFNPGLVPGATFPFISFNANTGTALSPPLLTDLRGHLFASSMRFQTSEGQVQIPEKATIVRLDPRASGAPVELAEFKFPISGTPRMQQSPDGRSMKFTLSYPGLVAADAWTVFRDGRVALVRGATYAIEFISPSGQRIALPAIPYDRFPVTDADRKAEMDEARRLMVAQNRMATRMMPAGVSMEFELLPPATWPEHYPPVAAMGLIAGADGRLWIKRAVPFRLGRERWDVVDQDGRLVARWHLPPRTTLLSVGQRGAYAVRTDDDDLRYLQRIELPR